MGLAIETNKREIHNGRCQPSRSRAAGQRLRRVRERLKLRYRDVFEASVQVAAAHEDNAEFVIRLSRLADIENRGIVPSIYRLYSLCTVYRLDLHEVLGWYGMQPENMALEASRTPLPESHLMQLAAAPREVLRFPHPEGNPKETTMRPDLLQNWGKLPLTIAGGVENGGLQYGFIGQEDWSMFPLLRPGSLVVLEPARKIWTKGWTSEYERPIYFLEKRDGYACGWASIAGRQLVLEPHPASGQPPVVFAYPEDIEVVGRVIGVAMSLGGPGHPRPAAAPLPISEHRPKASRDRICGAGPSSLVR
jgi:transcriptional regulator with XRE-family HTH domain